MKLLRNNIFDFFFLLFSFSKLNINTSFTINAFSFFVIKFYFEVSCLYLFAFNKRLKKNIKISIL